MQNSLSFGLSTAEKSELIAFYKELKLVKTQAFTVEECQYLVANNDKTIFREDRANWLKAIQQHKSNDGAKIATQLFEFYFADEDAERSFLLTVWDKLASSSVSANVDLGIVAMLWRQMGILETSQGHFDKAQVYFQKAIRHFLEIDDKTMLGNDHFELGLVFRNLGDYHNAWQTFEKSIEYARQAGNHKTVIYSQGQLANLLAIQSRFSEAIDILKASLEEWEKFPLESDRLMRHTSLHTLGRTYLQNGQFQEAKSSLQESLKLKEIVNERFDAIMRTRATLAEACLNLGEFDVAEKYLREADVDKLAHMGSYLYAAAAFKTLSQLSYAKKNFIEFERFANRAIDISEQSSNPLTQFEVLLWVLPAFLRRGKLIKFIMLVPPFINAFLQLRLSPLEIIKLAIKRLVVAISPMKRMEN
jgi:tetratricopeptide (TPR) repeat protein